MGTTSEKLTYLNGTKQLLKDKINNLGGSIDDNTTFRQYANQLQNVYDNLPKTEYQEGTEVNLGKTIKGKLDYENGVVGIGQSSQDSTTGKQLIPTSLAQMKSLNVAGTWNNNVYSYVGLTMTVNDDLSITINGTTTAGGLIYLFNSSSGFTLASGTYNISLKNKIAGVGLYTYSGTSTLEQYLSQNDATPDNKSFTLTQAKLLTQARISFASNSTFNNLTVYPMIESGSSMTGYEPYTNGASPNPSYPQQIKSVTGTQNVVVSGKNLYNDNAETEAYYYNASGEKVASPSASETYINLEYNLSDTAITISRATMVGSANIRICEYNGTAFIKRTLTTALDGETITLDSNTTRVIFSINKSSSAYFTNLMIEKGSTATTYEPYITPKSYQLSLGDIELCKIGNYRDYIYKSGDSWYVHKETASVTLNGTETWDYDSTYNYFKLPSYSFGNNTPLLMTSDNKETFYQYCNHFTINKNWSGTGSFRDSTTTQGIFYPIQNAGYKLVFRNTDYTSPSDFATWLTSNNVSVYYALETATDTEITDTSLIEQLEAWYNAHSNNGTTIITSNGDLPLIIKCRGLKGE